MTNEEAIENIKWYMGRYINGDTPTSILQSFEFAIKALEARPKGEWISVTERLPEEDEDVLITRVYNGSTHSFVEMSWFNECKFLTPDGEFELPNVVAWMPLPKPYMRGDE